MVVEGRYTSTIPVSFPPFPDNSAVECKGGVRVRVQLTQARPGAGSEDNGAIAIVVALTSVLILVLAAFAVDIGNAYSQSRQLSVSADAAALAAARAVGQVYPSPTCTTGDLAAIGADGIATTAATQVNAENNKSGQAATTDTVSAHAYCSQDQTAILVDVTTARDVRPASPASSASPAPTPTPPRQGSTYGP